MAEKEYFLYIDGQPIKVTEEIYREYKRAEDKERYFMRRIKKGRYVVDQEKGNVFYLPSREASLEQLVEAVRDIPAPSGTAEDMAPKIYQLEKLREALDSLSDMDRELIRKLFYEGKTEREVCEDLGMAKTTIHRRKAAILGQLKKFLEKF